MSREVVSEARAKSEMADWIATHVSHRLSEILNADPEALSKLVELRVPCKPAVETETAAVPHATSNGELHLGLLGVINAIISPFGRVIVANYAQDGDEVIGWFSHRELK
jgi:hypothetical protein